MGNYSMSTLKHYEEYKEWIVGENTQEVRIFL
jgi:hypothetical protein